MKQPVEEVIRRRHGVFRPWILSAVDAIPVRYAVIFGGVGQGPQTELLRRGVDVLVATPGRLLDQMERGHLDLGAVEVFVLDEADRMLDMGSVHAVRKAIAKLPRDRQSLLFSATMPADIVRLANSILRDPVRVEVTPPATTVDRINQSVLHVEKKDKRALLLEVLPLLLGGGRRRGQVDPAAVVVDRTRL